jgi:hypothetical protein
MVVLAILDKNGGCVAIDYQPEAFHQKSKNVIYGKKTYVG